MHYHTFKRSLLMAVCLLTAGHSLYAQKIVERRLEYSPGQKIVFDLPIGKSIVLHGWDKNEVSLTATIDINSNRLNEAYQLEVQEGEALTFTADLDEDILKGGKAIDCGEGKASYVSYNDKEQVVVCAYIHYVINVPRAAILQLKTISADIEAKGLEGDTEIKSISGFIDFNWQERQEAELALKSITGELYTDLDFDILNKKDMPQTVGYTLKGQIGDGGRRLALETISSDIYLRKR
ncbi:hypothetical protein OKW21_006259 [Catalinimonas alkaloidigena]|uniref:hypothetical protein n=1 Tax=Catalinimonas alkaloidigena TaxID=1075417 RepID=UPI00240507CA|nr:hypothetical protein [Catalinimonas alkaloidigena]MDF9800996.1 hypothetical protein [Catalinimonas alkaloidigena]